AAPDPDPPGRHPGRLQRALGALSRARARGRPLRSGQPAPPPVPPGAHEGVVAVSPAPETVLGVAALTRLIKERLADAFPAVRVKGEVSGFKRSDRGHLYFSLKD